MNIKPSTGNDHTTSWIGGWSISSPEESLLRETFSPLDVSLSPENGKIALRAANINGALFMTDPADGILHLFAHGLRFIRETAEGTRLFSFYKNTPNSLIIEADDPHLDFISDGEIKQIDDGETIVATHGQHRMTIVADWKRSPVRMAVLAGSGDPEQLAARAKALLAKSAHLAHDQLAKAGDRANADESTLDAFSYLAGSFRPASQHWPGPWLAGDNDQPMLDGAMLLVLAHVLSAAKSSLLHSMITNPLEAISQDARNHRLIEQMARVPLIMQTMQRFPMPQEQWMGFSEACAPGIKAYLNEAGKPASFVPGAASPLVAKLRPWLWRREVQAWKMLADKAGLGITAAIPGTPGGSADDPSWLVLLDEERASSLDPAAIEHALGELTSALAQEHDEDTPVYWALAALLLDSSTLMARPALRRTFRKQVVDLARATWKQRAASMRIAGRVTYDPASLPVATVAAWAELSPADDQPDEGEKSRAILWQLSNRRGRLVTLAAVIVALFAAWVVSIQFRRTLPPSAFETRIGMIQHFYQTGDYEMALEKLDELERIGALSLGLLHSWRGKVLYRKGEFEAAGESFAQAAQELEQNPAPLFNLALSQFSRGDYAAAKTSFENLAATFRGTHPSTSVRALRAAAICAEMDENLKN